MTDNRCVNVTAEFGLVVRRKALVERGVPLNALLAALEADAPLDCNDFLLTFGPHFGQEAMEAMVGRLTRLGLVYYDDFFEFAGDYPNWCLFKAVSFQEA